MVGAHNLNSETVGSHPTTCFRFGTAAPPLLLIGTVRVRVANHYSRAHVLFVSTERIDHGLVLGIVMEQIAQRKEGMFSQVWNFFFSNESRPKT